ncbi:hypothetical protein [Wolbachia endosymbiont of Folsomia candida]|uniref:hypothetical protein n=1 Tax=Wolbachia endosymbiont of Folsomia candida TaxID=169402 RepID=UPI000B286FAB|nr:hypothetical protein [Wolbachia endosymbiont of Folsomia candida]APR97929.1 hypothetical protein ASM33_01185 [Wolbachia endosymbiont of Folsomia candida]
MLEKIKKMLDHIKSWFATTWIWNTIKNLFSSNDASKASSAQYEGPVYDPKAEEKALAAKRLKEEAKDAETPKEPEGNRPEEKVSAPNKKMPQPEEVKIIGGVEQAENGNKENPGVTSEPVDLGANGDQQEKHVEKPQKEPVGYIKKVTDSDHYPQLFVQKDYAFLVETNRNIEGDWSKIYVTIGGKACHMIVRFIESNTIGEHTFFYILSVGMQDGKYVSFDDLLDLNGGTEAKVTDISDKPFPEVESPANGEAPSPSTVSKSRKINISLLLKGGELVFSPVLPDLLSMKRKESMKMGSPSSETANPQSQQQAAAGTGTSRT